MALSSSDVTRDYPKVAKESVGNIILINCHFHLLITSASGRLRDIIVIHLALGNLILDDQVHHLVKCKLKHVGHFKIKVSFYPNQKQVEKIMMVPGWQKLREGAKGLR